MTSQLQPPDVSVNKPFKYYLRKEYEAWLLPENLPLTPSGKFRGAFASNLAKWVSAATCIHVYILVTSVTRTGLNIST
jgi:hypothetical protein